MVQKLDNGSGTVTGTVGLAIDGNTGDGINCGTNCQENYFVGTDISLKATPDAGSVFKGWEGDCAGTSGDTFTTTIS